MAYWGLEKGGIEQHLHFQGVVVTKEPMHDNGVNAAIRRYVGWLEDQSLGWVKVNALTHNRDLHTHRGMLGYCSKDRGKPWFQLRES